MEKIQLLFAQYEVDVSPLPNIAAGSGKVQGILAIVFGVLGALSVLMVVIGGFRYVASQGDPQATAKAKGTIIYAVIGLVVAIFSITIVTFVLRNV